MNKKLLLAVCIAGLIGGAGLTSAQQGTSAKSAAPAGDERIGKLLEQNQQILKQQAEILKQLEEIKVQIGALRRRSS